MLRPTLDLYLLGVSALTFPRRSQISRRVPCRYQRRALWYIWARTRFSLEEGSRKGVSYLKDCLANSPWCSFSGLSMTKSVQTRKRKKLTTPWKMGEAANYCQIAEGISICYEEVWDVIETEGRKLSTHLRTKNHCFNSSCSGTLAIIEAYVLELKKTWLQITRVGHIPLKHMQLTRERTCINSDGLGLAKCHIWLATWMLAEVRGPSAPGLVTVASGIFLWCKIRSNHPRDSFS